MKKVQLDVVEQTNTATLYTLHYIGDEYSEFEKFILRFKDSARLQRDYRIILVALQKIAQNGALERYFRPEGKMNDGVCAIPLDSGKLRLYCLRLSDQVLIIGNGGEKSTRTYEENEKLAGYVMDLQQFQAIINAEVARGNINIEQSSLDEIEFEI